MQTFSNFEKIPRGLIWSNSPIWQRHSAPRRPPCKPSRDLNSCNAQIEVGPESRRPPRSEVFSKDQNDPDFLHRAMSASLRNQESNSNCSFDAVTFEIERGSKHCTPDGSALDRRVSARPQNARHETMSRLRAISR